MLAARFRLNLRDGVVYHRRRDSESNPSATLIASFGAHTSTAQVRFKGRGIMPLSAGLAPFAWLEPAHCRGSPILLAEGGSR